MIKSLNGLTIEVYSSGTTRISDFANELAWAENLTFSTGYPGGLYLQASFTVPRSIVEWWELKGAQRVVFRQGGIIVYEGYIQSLERLLTEQGQAITVPLAGGWGHIMMSRRWQKWWADNRIDESVWKWGSQLSGADKCHIDRAGQLKFIPKAETWNNDDTAAIFFAMPTADTVKRASFDYDFAEGAQSWRFGFQLATGTDATGSATPMWEITADGTGVQNITLGTANQYVRFFFHNNSGGTQAPTSNGSIYGKVTNLFIFSEVATTTPTSVATSVINHFTDLNTSTALVSSNTLELKPFISDWDTAADIVAMAASFGDASNNRWGFGLRHSEIVASPDGKPVLFYEQWPDLTDYDYALRLEEENIVSDVNIVQDFESIANWIIINYGDESGWPVWVTPDDDATLKDTTSIADYGQRDHLLSLGYSTSDVAKSNAKRILAAYKDPEWNADPITVFWVRHKDGYEIPAARIESGKRLKIENFQADVIMLITATQYDDDSQTTTMTFGRRVDPLLTMLTPPPRALEEDWGEDDSYGSSGGGGDKSHNQSLNWRRRKLFKDYAKKKGVDLWKIKGMSKEKRDFIKEAKAWKRRKNKKRRG